MRHLQSSITPDYDDFGRMTQSTTVNGSNQGVDFLYLGRYIIVL